MLWQVGDENPEQYQTNEIIGDWVKYWERRVDVHREDEIKDVWGGELGASTVGSLVCLVRIHGGCTSLVYWMTKFGCM